MAHQKLESDKILVIEDDLHISELLSVTLARERFTPIVAHDGGIGLSEARRLLPSLILLDIMLPTMDGWEVCRRLKAEEQTRAIPIIMVTAKSEEEDRSAEKSRWIPAARYTSRPCGASDTGSGTRTARFENTVYSRVATMFDALESNHANFWVKGIKLVLSLLILTILAALAGGVIKTFLDLRLLFNNPVEVALRHVTVDTLILLAVVEVFKTTLTYFTEGRVKVTFIVDTILVVM